ncbi:Scr1 family TA system antitoxin-like transcriptional regulator [Streptomyces sp. NPDC008092]|uniref:helix-turn-helix domain-containing protein n=1 Tax=Streptomyces sp. NPDC008092 TaxID=3364808 RepID=UPI0036EF1A6D
MAKRVEPTARQLRLAVELRRLRETAGLSSREAAALLGVNAPQISQIESGLAGVSEKRLRLLAANYSCSDGELIEALAAMTKDRTRGWWEDYQGLLPAPFLDLAELEHHATFLREAQFLYIPGLLQTADYARAVYAYRIPELPHTELKSRVEHRMRRKAVLDGTPFDAIVHEAALRIMVGDRAASRAQLSEVLEVSEADNVSVRVIPFAEEGFAGAASAMLYAGGAVSRLDTVVRDGPNGAAYVDSAVQLGALRTLLRKLEAASLNPDKSRDLINRVAKEL